MAKFHICCVGIDFPGEEFQYVSFHSGASLFDADIVLFQPNLDFETKLGASTYKGLPNLSDESSVKNRSSLLHWKRELSEALENEKTIFVFLRKPVEVFAATGTEEYTGTGKSRSVISHVDKITSYDALPVTFDSLAIAKGTKVNLTKDGGLLASYLRSLQELLHYEVYCSHERSTPLLCTRKGEKTVASLIKGKKGHLLLLPVLDFGQEDFEGYDEDKGPVWTEKAVKFGRILLTAVVEIHESLTQASARSPEPEWVQQDAFQLKAECDLASEISEIHKRIKRLSAERVKLEFYLEAASLPKALLYEKGKALELSVIDALKTIGFSASNYSDGELEFDILFESDEGRFLGEAEGKDHAAINIEKLQQLERNIQEDFTREGVEVYAKGVLFGNPHRLVEPSKKETLFTKKALSAAKRSGFALVHTADLFPIVKYLKEKEDPAYAQEIRRCLASTSGEIVRFPPVPEST